MNKIVSALLLLTGLAMLSTSATAETTVNWKAPKEYTDLQSPERTTRGNQRLLETLDRYFKRISDAAVGDQYNLTFTIDDVDLAGWMMPNFGMSGPTNIRVVKPGRDARLNFSYAITGAQGKLIDEGEASLRSGLRAPRAATSAYPDVKWIFKRWLTRQAREWFPEP